MTMTMDGLEGSRFYSDFSLRPPLPRRKSDFETIHASSNEIEKKTSLTENPKTQAQSTVRSISSPTSLSPPASVLFRMYVACHVLRLGTETRFTALVLLHRYAQAKQTSTTTEDREDWPWVGGVCLFLACKAEDEPRRLRDIINMAQMVLSPPDTTTTPRDDRGDEQVETMINNTVDNDRDHFSTIVMDMTRTPPLDGAYWDSKKKAIETEQMVLRWLGFDCSVSYPHRAVFWILEKMMNARGPRDHQRHHRHHHRHRDWQQRSPRSSESVDGKNDLRMPRKRKHGDSAEMYNGNRDDDETNNAASESTNNCTNIHDNNIQEELLSLAYRRLNDALFYPQALRCGVIELACAAIDLVVVQGFEQNSDHSHSAAESSAAAADATTGQSLDENHNVDTNTATTNSFSSLRSTFKHEWWIECGISSKDFDDCRNNLKEATSYLRTIAATEKYRPGTVISTKLS